MLRAMTDVVVRRCPPSKRRQALERVLATVSSDQRGSIIATLRPEAEQGVDVFAGLAIAEIRQQVVGAAWLQPQVGRTATLWPADTDDSLSHDSVLQLNRLALSATDTFSTSLVQTLLSSSDQGTAAHLLALGFVHLADLKYLMHLVPSRVTAPDCHIRLLSPATNFGREFEQLILQTYESTLDCPGLEGLRDIRDVLDGYRTIGTHDPALWHLVEWRSDKVGVVLLAPYPESRQWELVYMGVVPRARGNRIGEAILAEVRFRASMEGIEQIVLAVDAANVPALHMYEAANFTEWSTRAAYVKRIRANDTN